MPHSAYQEKPAMPELIKQRSQIYDFFAQVFMEPVPVPGDAYAKKILANISAVLGSADDEQHEGNRLLQSFLNACLLLDPQKVQEKIAIDRTFLCRGIDQKNGPLPPYEAFYHNEWHGQNVSIDLIDFYHQNGFALNEGIKERPDYIGIELAFMSELCHKELEASANPDAFLNIIQQEREFFTQHLAQWLPEYCRQISTWAKTDFFKGIAVYLLDFLQDEQNYLTETA